MSLLWTVWNKVELNWIELNWIEDLKLSSNLHLPSILFTPNIVPSHFLRRDRDLDIS